jgi:DNA-binding NarL/FixJ family response regulator
LGRAQPIRVVVAGDSAVRNVLAPDVVGHALAASSGVEVVAEVIDGQATLALIRELLPDVLVVQHDPPLRDAIMIAETVTDQQLDVRVLMLAGELDDDHMLRAFRAGVASLPRSASNERILNAVRSCAFGDAVVARSTLLRIAERRRRPLSGREGLLTRRELKVLELVASGKGVRGTARELTISATTVKKHLGNAYRKLGVSSATAAVAEAMRSGLLE